MELLNCDKKGGKAGWGLGRRRRLQWGQEKATSWVMEEENLELEWAGGREQPLLRRDDISAHIQEERWWVEENWLQQSVVRGWEPRRDLRRNLGYLTREEGRAKAQRHRSVVEMVFKHQEVRRSVEQVVQGEMTNTIGKDIGPLPPVQPWERWRHPQSAVKSSRYLWHRKTPSLHLRKPLLGASGVAQAPMGFLRVVTVFPGQVSSVPSIDLTSATVTCASWCLFCVHLLLWLDFFIFTYSNSM